MADVFEDRKKLYPWRARLFQTIWQTENLDWLLLTKRPENIARLIEQAGEYYVCRDGVIRDISREIIAWGFGGYLPSNIWLGASIENMQTAKERIHHLVAATAPVKFLSCEPLLDWLDLSFWLFKCRECQQRFDYSAGFSLFTQESGQGECSLDMHEIIPAPLLDWIIIGGESGLHARPFNLDYALALLTQCQQAGVPVFVKQMGAVPVISANAWKALDNKPALKARIHYNIPAGYLALKFNDPKGADPAEWPAEFRIQQFPQPKAWKDMPGIIGT
jgi:protein gp37